MVGGEQCSTVSNRLKREKCNRTKHDSSFSPWKILIGPCDWEEYWRGKQGCARYRIDNLPEETVPGVYELGIAVSASGLGRHIYKLAPHRILVVYLGQADNVRARLQHYGRNGAHLTASLFQDIFSQGYPILYRWAPMRNKEDAKRTEAQLLATFDYAWNTTNNATCRPHDILHKLNKIASPTITFSDMANLLLPFAQRQVGIRINSTKAPQHNGIGSYNFLSRVFKFNTSRPRMVQDVIQDNASICGVPLGDGSVCTRPLARATKRCPEHKGMPTAKSSHNFDTLEADVHCQTKGSCYNRQNHVQHPPQPQIVLHGISNTNNICGILLDDGSTCTRQPVAGRKRCQEHKGTITNAKVIGAPNPDNIEILEHNVYCQTKDNDSKDQNIDRYAEDPPQKVLESSIDKGVTNTNICGIISYDGSTCTRQPIQGRKRCHEHKGKRIRAFIHIKRYEILECSVYCQTKDSDPNYQNIDHYAEDPPQKVLECSIDKSVTNFNICGIISGDGSTCKRQPVKGRKRCHEHKGKRIRAFIHIKR